MDALLVVQADDDFYRAVDQVTDRGAEYRPSTVPAGWRCAEENIWRMWRLAYGGAPAAQGWKVHVSARFDRAAAVLDRTAAVCFAQEVPFKHLACARFFLLAHHKHGHRAQSGKFCAAYPRDEAAARRLLDALA